MNVSPTRGQGVAEPGGDRRTVRREPKIRPIDVPRRVFTGHLVVALGLGATALGGVLATPAHAENDQDQPPDRGNTRWWPHSRQQDRRQLRQQTIPPRQQQQTQDRQ